MTGVARLSVAPAVAAACPRPVTLNLLMLIYPAPSPIDAYHCDKGQACNRIFISSIEFDGVMTLSAGTTTKFIYKVCDIALWQDAERAGVFTGAEIDLSDGYIHFSTASQLQDTLARHFAGRDGLVLLTVDCAPLDIKWEAARGGALFPHLYDVLPLDCVVAQHHLQLSASGDHILPENVISHD
jgi:uncharacterized protein (DUF952 family)